MNQNNNRQSEGFTIIELMIAMAFIATLLLAIVGTVMQIGAVYNRGVAMKSVNQAGRAVVADMKRAIAESPLLAIPMATDSTYGRSNPFILQDVNGNSITSAGVDVYGGRLCTGVYSYVWNIGKLNSQVNKFSGTSSSKQLNLVKVRDNGGTYCKARANSPIDFSDSANNQVAFELLSENNLAVEDLKINAATRNTGSGAALYTISIVIGSANQDEISTMNTCNPPEDTGSYQNYCSVNQFVFTARAGNKGGE